MDWKGSYRTGGSNRTKMVTQWTALVAQKPVQVTQNTSMVTKGTYWY